MICDKCGRFTGVQFGGEPFPCECRKFTFTAGLASLNLYAFGLDEAVENCGKAWGLRHMSEFKASVEDSATGNVVDIVIEPQEVVKYAYRKL